MGALAVVGLLATSCQYLLTHPGVSAACGPLEVEINHQGATLDGARRAAVIDAVEEFGALVGRPVVDLGDTTANVVDHQPGDPLLIEVAWPVEAPAHLGYAEPQVVGSAMVDGWMYLNPIVAGAPNFVIRRLVLHELGHLAGLGDVEDRAELMNPALTAADWGDGDLAALFAVHGGGCSTDATVAARLFAALSG